MDPPSASMMPWWTSTKLTSSVSIRDILLCVPRLDVQLLNVVIVFFLMGFLFWLWRVWFTKIGKNAARRVKQHREKREREIMARLGMPISENEEDSEKLKKNMLLTAESPVEKAGKGEGGKGGDPTNNGNNTAQKENKRRHLLKQKINTLLNQDPDCYDWYNWPRSDH
jgi:hypothetical protein